LAIVDLLTGSVAIPLTVFSVLTKQPYNYDMCLLLHSSVIALCTVSIFHLLVISADKYLSICKCVVLRSSGQTLLCAVVTPGTTINGMAAPRS
jgi:hypothetical protein